jgi:LysR family transcriptional regulator, glycine cleavage system transcriptional activator
MRRLPPFPELVAFESVARHSSFTRAAEELCLTQSAVSHRVRRLEAYLGTPLIDRLNPGIALTDAGAAMLPELAVALETLARLNGPRERRLRVVAGSALCNWWLAGRLAAFLAEQPGVSVELMSRDAPDPTVRDVDIWIGWVDAGEDAPSETQAPLFNEHVFPVCSPALLPGGHARLDTGALAKMPLLHKAMPGTGEWSWSFWLDRLGIERPQSKDGELRFADMGLILSAAVNGAGVALVRSLLTHDALADGRLVVPVAGIEPMTSAKKHVARWPSQKADDPDIDAFVGWLVVEAARTLAETEALVRAPASAERADAGTTSGGD